MGTDGQTELIPAWLQYSRGLLQREAVFSAVRFLWLFVKMYFFTALTFLVFLILCMIYGVFFSAPRGEEMLIIRGVIWYCELPLLYMALLAALADGILLGVLFGWHSWRGLDALNTEPDSTAISGAQPQFMNIKRTSNMHYGFALGMWWQNYLTSFHAPLAGILRLIKDMGELLRPQPSYPPEAEAVTAELVAAHQMRSWNAAAEIPGLLPLLETMLALRLIRTRTNYARELEVHLCEPFLRFYERKTTSAEAVPLP